MMISVIIPSYNRREMLEQTLRSVQQSVGEAPCEVIVVDDGSTDGTVEWLATQPQIQWFQQRNAGPSAARNLAAAHANGRYLAFLDSDDLWFPWTYPMYLEVINRTAAAFIAGKPFRFSEISQINAMAHSPVQILQFKDYLASGDEWRWWGCSSFLIRKDVFDAVHGFTAQRVNAEDADLCLRLGEAPGFVQISSPATFAYREHAVSEMKNTTLNFKGIEHLLNSHETGGYPGVSNRSSEYWRILSRHLRPAALEALTANRPLAWRIFRATLPHHLRTLRWKFLLGFLLKAIR